jgi:mono/diheme cytochrome c family protein
MRSSRKGTRTFFLLAFGVFVSIFVMSLTIAAGAQSSPAASGDQAQIEKGRQVVMQACAACHANIGAMLQGYRQSPERWRSTVYYMISRGAQVMPDEIEPVIAYVVATATGPVRTQAGRGGGGRGGGNANAELSVGGQGRAIFDRACVQCHDAATASTKMPSETWDDVVRRMVSYGARVSSAEQQTLLGYLGAPRN